MFGIEPVMASNDSRALSGRSEIPPARTQGVVLAHSALGWVLMAFQAAEFATQRVARIQPRAERSDALGYGHPKRIAP
jgi:hypothetical protein